MKFSNNIYYLAYFCYALFMYTDDDLLMLSGIQHIAFCERQYALIYIEQQWAENVLTLEGHFLHEKVNDPFEYETRNDRIFLRALHLVSYNLGLYGVADLIEFCKVENNENGNAIKLKDRSGWWKPIPVEFKRGKPKSDPCDEVQLCAQAICLEEMYKIKISEGFIYYGEIKHRFMVEFNTELRNKVRQFALRMHQLFSEGKTPEPVLKKGCKSCSMFDYCIPDKLSSLHSASEYLKQLNL